MKHTNKILKIAKCALTVERCRFGTGVKPIFKCEKLPSNGSSFCSCEVPGDGVTTLSMSEWTIKTKESVNTFIF